MSTRITRSASATPAKKKKPVREIITISDSEDERIEAPAPKRAKGKGKAKLAVKTGKESIAETQEPLDSTDPKGAIQALLFTAFTACTCSQLLSPPTPATRPTFNDPASDFLARSAIKCNCGKLVCRGCCTPVDPSEVGKCCPEGRAIVIFEVLAALDDLYLADGRLAKPKANAVAVPSKGRKTKPTGLGGGTGYSVNAAAAINDLLMGMDDEMDDDGYFWGDEDEGDFGEHVDHDAEAEMMMMQGIAGGHHHGVPAVAVPFVVKDADKFKEHDRLLTVALSLLASLLPHPDSPDALGFDFMPSPTLTPLLLLSTLPEILSDLLRNDSVPDWAARSDLYFAMLAAVAAICEESGTVAVFFAERRSILWTEGIGKWMAGEGKIEWTRQAVPVVKGAKRKAKGNPPPPPSVLFVSPLFALFSRLSHQAAAFRKLATTSDGAFSAEDSALLGICGDICDTGEKCQRTLEVWTQISARDNAVPDGKGKEVAIVERGYDRDDYPSFCRLHSYSQDISLSANTAGKITYNHAYAKEITAIANSRRGNVGFVHLVKELAVLSTSLPSGIFVRVDESRIDVIKCLIAGPVDTPYQGGLFEFDVFIPLQYPQVPPVVTLKTTGSGRVRFNPNLYANGKTCLSLIGTWEGRPEEMWLPKSSTLLQVFLSIQSMILGTAFPFFNEPGFGAAEDNANSKNYNKNVSLATVRYAMIDWMAPEKKTSIWADVICGHFSLLGDEILATARKWEKKDSRMKAWKVDYDASAGSHVAAPAPRTAANKATAAATPTRNLIVELTSALEAVAQWKSMEELCTAT